MKTTSFGFSILFGLVVVSACSSNDDNDGDGTATAGAEISVSGNSFAPQQVTIKVGQTVHWSWTGGPHNVVSGANCQSDGKFTSGEVTANGDFEQQFTTAGKFPFFCTPHCTMGMTGEVIVEP